MAEETHAKTYLITISSIHEEIPDEYIRYLIDTVGDDNEFTGEDSQIEVRQINPRGKTYAPWVGSQVENLNRYQRGEFFHPFTCGNRADHPQGDEIPYETREGILTATENGWVCPSPECGYTQDLAHNFMAHYTARIDENLVWKEEETNE